jgi:phenylglyoxylate dehydrogenase beta subunit
MNTGMQSSSSTTFGSWTSTTPVSDKMHGKGSDAKNMPLIMLMHNCSYVATASLSFIEDYYKKLDKALDASNTGLAYLHVYAPCPSGWRFPAAKTIDICRLMVESNFITLWEYSPDNGLVFTRSVDNPAPLETYLKAIGKYRHLGPDQIARIKEQTETNLENARRFIKSGGQADR